MTPSAFIDKWRDSRLSEKAGAQSFFLDLCDMVGVEKPDDPDNYCFERGATRTGAGHGWADVWKRDCFAWENKGPDGDLSRALKQLMTYALALDNPPLLVVCNRALIEIHTHFTGTPSEVHTIRLDDVGQPENLQKLSWVFTAPDKFRPNRTVLDVTSEAAGRFADLAQSISTRGHAPEKVAHFLTQCLFAMFAEDAGLLPEKLFQRIVGKSAGSPEKLAARLGDLFQSMQSGGDFMLEDIAWFNGGLFQVIEPIPLVASEVSTLLAASNMNWSHIEPSIFGTMFERGLDPRMRAQLGAQFTDPDTINKIIEPVIVRPLAAEWEAAKLVIAKAMVKYQAGGKGSQSGLKTAQETLLRFVERLKNFRVLDPACGSGNFLYLALRALKDLEHRANLDAEALGLHRQLTIETSPANVLGIEINAYAAELARVTVWIGEIQWMLKNGYDVQRKPVLAPLDHIQCRDAIITASGTEAAWPAVDVVVGNPPFLGAKKLLPTLGEDYVASLRAIYEADTGRGCDLVCYWFAKALRMMAEKKLNRAGLVATQSIRNGVSRTVLERISTAAPIFCAWSDQPWVNDGAAVRVSFICFGRTGDPVTLDGAPCGAIGANLRANDKFDLPQAKPLATNQRIAFQGLIPRGDFVIDGAQARKWFVQPNAHHQPNSKVLFPYLIGRDVVRRREDSWVIAMPDDCTLAEASLYQLPFAWLDERVKPFRQTTNQATSRNLWWRHWCPRPELKAAIAGLTRYIVTPRVAKHRLFTFVPIAFLPDSRLYAFARQDMAFFGFLHSRLHEVWSLATCSMHGKGNDPTYNAHSCFETYPFPDGLLTADEPDAVFSAVAAAAQALNALREGWLNPPEWIDRVAEAMPGYPDRVVAKRGHEKDLKRRTLTNLYNERPTWLDHAHKALDAAVAVAYGWSDYTPTMPDEEILRRLLELNMQRAGAQ